MQSVVKDGIQVHYSLLLTEGNALILLKVKEVAQARGISQGKLSRIADIDVKTVRRVFRNPAEIITTETLDKLATALGVHVCELITHIPNTPQTSKKPESSPDNPGN